MSYDQTFEGKFVFADARCLEAGLDRLQRPLDQTFDACRGWSALHLAAHTAEAGAGDLDDRAGHLDKRAPELGRWLAAPEVMAAAISSGESVLVDLLLEHGATLPGKTTGKKTGKKTSKKASPSSPE